MTRRKKTQKKSILTKEIKLKRGGSLSKIPFRVFGSRDSSGGEKNFKFSINLIILTAALEMSLLILLLTLVNGQTMEKSNTSSFLAAANTGSKQSSSVGQDLNDAELGFKLVIPSQLGDWKYKVGYVKSLVDDSLSNQYLRIYIPENSVKKSRNFDEVNKGYLTILKFGLDEWSKLEKGCEKGNLIFCETMGKKIAEKNESVYAYTEISGCSSNKSENKCKLINKIIDSFQLK